MIRLRGFDRRSLVRIAVAVVVGAIAGLALHHLRGYFPRIAMISGLAITILTYMAIGTAERLWRIWRG